MLDDTASAGKHWASHYNRTAGHRVACGLRGPGLDKEAGGVCAAIPATAFGGIGHHRDRRSLRQDHFAGLDEAPIIIGQFVSAVPPPHPSSSLTVDWGVAGGRARYPSPHQRVVLKLPVLDAQVPRWPALRESQEPGRRKTPLTREQFHLVLSRNAVSQGRVPNRVYDRYLHSPGIARPAVLSQAGLANFNQPERPRTKVNYKNPAAEPPLLLDHGRPSIRICPPVGEPLSNFKATAGRGALLPTGPQGVPGPPAHWPGPGRLGGSSRTNAPSNWTVEHARCRQRPSLPRAETRRGPSPS